MAETGRIRNKRSNFTQVSNSPLRDNKLSLRAKGLYSLIQSYITIENFTLYKTSLQKMCVEGRDAFNKVWKELLDSGYLVMYKLQDENGRFYYEYELMDEKPLKTQDSLPPTEKPSMDENPCTENPYVVKPHVVNPYVGDSVPIIIQTNNTDANNTNSSNKLLLQEDKKDDVVVVDNSLQSCIQAYVDNFGEKPNPAVKKDMSKYIQSLSEYDVIYAIEVAATKGKGYDYSKGVLRQLWIDKYSKHQD